MNGMNFNERARFVYTRLLPLLQTATGGDVEGLTYEACGDDEDVVLFFADGTRKRVCVAGNNLLALTDEVLGVCS